MLRRGECLSAGDFAIAFGVFGHSKISCIVLFSAFGNSLKGGGVFALYAPAWLFVGAFSRAIPVWLAVLTLGSICYQRQVGLCSHPRERLTPAFVAWPWDMEQSWFLLFDTRVCRLGCLNILDEVVSANSFVQVVGAWFCSISPIHLWLHRGRAFRDLFSSAFGTWRTGSSGFRLRWLEG